MNRLITVTAASFVLCLISSAQAASVTWVAVGTVDRVDSALAATFSLGDQFRLEYTFETTTPDNLGGDPLRGRYAAISAATVNVAGYTATATAGNILVFNDFGGPLDIYQVNPVGWSGADVGGLSLGFPSIELRDSTGTAFANDSLPLSTDLLADFSNRSMSIDFVPNSNNDPVSFIVASVDSLTVSAIPVPAGIWLFGSALGLLGWLRRPARNARFG